MVFTFSVEMFDNAVSREFCRPPDQTLLALARDDRVGRLLVADPWRSYALSTARRRPLRLVEPISVNGRAAVRVRPHRFRRLDSTRTSTVARSYRSYGQLLGKALARTRGEARARPESAALVTYNPFVAAYCDAPWIANVVFFCQDDWATGEGRASMVGRVPRRLSPYRRTWAAIFVVSEELATRISPRANVVPNGVNPDVWRPRHPDQRGSTSCRGHVPSTQARSTTASKRGLVELTAGAVGSLIMIGHYGDPSVIRWLRSIDNVHVFDTVGQVELAATVQACDLGIIPHRDQAGIRAMSPLKLYEYLAAGLPVLAVDLPPLRGVDDDRVRLCRPDGVGASALSSLFGWHAPEDARLRFIDEVAWARRMQPVVDAAVRQAS